MTIYLLNSDARQIPLADQSVQCIITSPPYYGLRDYGTAQWRGGDSMCDHKQTVARHDAGRVNTNGFHGSAAHDSDKGAISYRDVCKVCGAIRIDKQIGLEPTPAAYVASIVAVMRECWRVLKDDGVLWLNLGDSYARDSSKGEKFRNGKGHRWSGQNPNGLIGPDVPDGLKPKDLIGIPWRCAFALQDDGWYLRSDIIWNKPNPMPESVTDRPTKAHEYIFLLTKRARYYYDAAAIADKRVSDHDAASYRGGAYIHNEIDNSTMGKRKSFGDKKVDIDTNRNRRSVWTVATTPYSGAHFATFPPKLIEPMILAGSRPGDLILDPFAGTATVGRVAIKHQRRFVGLDLNLKYIGDLAKERTSKVQVSMQFATEP